MVNAFSVSREYPSMSNLIRSALFVDFDNIFGGLREDGDQLAIDFAQNPGTWFQILETYGLSQDWKRSLIRKIVYINIDGKVESPEFGSLDFAKYTPLLVSAGFELMPCPPLTKQGKTAMDMQIAVDVLELLYAPIQNGKTAIDEFIIASSDADFTPVLKKISANNKRTMIMSAGKASSAYLGVADKYIQRDMLITCRESVRHSETLPIPQVISLIQKQLDGGKTPLSLKKLSQYYAGTKVEIDGTKCVVDSYLFLKALLILHSSPTRAVTGDYVRNPTIHPEPLQKYLQAQDTIPKFIEETCENIAELPAINNEAWSKIFEAFSRTVNEEQSEFNLREQRSYDEFVRDNIAGGVDTQHRQGGYLGSVFHYYRQNWLRDKLKDEFENNERLIFGKINDEQLSQIVSFVFHAYFDGAVAHDITGTVQTRDIRLALFYGMINDCQKKGYKPTISEWLQLFAWFIEE